jgi:hypothetical protein
LSGCIFQAASEHINSTESTLSAATPQGQAAAEAQTAAAGHGTLSTLTALAHHHAPGGGFAQPFWRQLVECTGRSLGSYWKDPAYNLLRLLMTAACALVYGTM